LDQGNGLHLRAVLPVPIGSNAAEGAQCRDDAINASEEIARLRLLCIRREVEACSALPVREDGQISGRAACGFRFAHSPSL